MKSCSGVLLLTYPPCFLLILPPHQQCPPLRNPKLSPHLIRQFHTRYRRWDPNAETSRTQNFNFNFNPNSNPLEEEEDDDNHNDDKNQWSWVLEEFIDGVWIFKVFRSYGWMLPAIILSILLATGPKAFLMALALPLGQSALSFAFQLVWRRTQKNPKRKAKSKKNPGPCTAFNVELEEEEESRGNRKGTKGYQTWVAGNDVPVDKGSQVEPSFGGWDELDRRTEFTVGYARNSTWTAKGPRKTLKSKMSRRERRSGVPLLWRLLIAIFPFLGTWTSKML